jgi:hypothetical protein
MAQMRVLMERQAALIERLWPSAPKPKRAPHPEIVLAVIAAAELILIAFLIGAPQASADYIALIDRLCQRCRRRARRSLSMTSGSASGAARSTRRPPSSPTTTRLLALAREARRVSMKAEQDERDAA